MEVVFLLVIFSFLIKLVRLGHGLELAQVLQTTSGRQPRYPRCEKPPDGISGGKSQHEIW